MVDVNLIYPHNLTTLRTHWEWDTPSNMKFIDSLLENFDIKNAAVKVDPNCYNLSLETGIEPLLFQPDSHSPQPGYVSVLIFYASSH